MCLLEKVVYLSKNMMIKLPHNWKINKIELIEVLLS